MKPPPFTDPFVDLEHQPKEFLDTILRARKEEARARKQYASVMKAYRELVKNPEYAPIYKDALRAMGLNLAALVESGMKCSRCVQFAAPVKSLQDVVLDPMEQVWLETTRERAEEGAEEA